MGTIVEFLPSASEAFTPEAVEAMSTALDDVCLALNLAGRPAAREIVAIRIIELARRGELNAARLTATVLAEAGGSPQPARKA